jgi:hypothetical protein
MRTPLSAVALLSLVATGSSPQEAARIEGAAPLSVPFAPGERFEYRIKVGLFTVGRATMEVVRIDTVRGEPTWHVRFTIRGGALGYSLNDSLQSWIGMRDFASRRFIQDSEQNGRERFRRYEIHPERGFWIRNERDTVATVENPLDDASFFYYARTIPLEPGRTYDIPRYFQRDRNPVTIRVLQRQTTSVPAGRFDCVVIRPVFKSRGIFAEGGEAYIWFTDDAARIPVKIRSRLPFGTLEMQMVSRR